MKLRDYQTEIANKGVGILWKHNILYLAMQVRTGKTITAMEVARLIKAKNVLFCTKKKAINSILNDYLDFGFDKDFKLSVINAESLHKLEGEFDLVISDEHHKYGAFPKPSKSTKEFKLRFSRVPMIMLSGTMAAESYSQVYHQFWVSAYSPFKEPTFYKWAANYVDVKQKHLGYGVIKDYSQAKKEMIDKVIDPYVLKFTQKEAGFETKVNEIVLHHEACNKKIIDKLKKDLVIEGKSEVILADTGTKLMCKIHQLESGTIKFESGKSMVLDQSKAEYIRDYFKGKKLAIFYYYKEEEIMLRFVFPNSTTDIDEFNSTDKHYIGQQYSSAMGINLSSADCLVFYNFGFSGTNYLQSIDRLTTMDRKNNDVYFVYGKGSLTEKIHNVVKQKKNFTIKQFENARK